jgi:lipoyl(octanoyl) transferase
MLSSVPPIYSPTDLEIYLLGLVDFEDAQALQRRLVYDLGETGGASLILCEHPPTISVGRSGSRSHIRPDDEELREHGIRVHWVNRGGGCILHGPGQLSAYFAMSLDPSHLDLKGYVDRLHRTIQAVLEEFDLKGTVRHDAPGVYLGHARVAAVGVAVSRWIAYHGVTLNVGSYLSDFDILDEPGHGGYRLHQTSMESRRQRPTPMAKVRESMIRNLETVFGLERHHLYTDHPLIRRKARPHVHVPSLG